VKLFLDTSSLIKLYYKEDGTSRLDQIFLSSSVKQIFLSEISITEFYSAIYKKVRTKDLTQQNANDILDSFKADQNKFTFIPVNSEVIGYSQILLMKYGPKGLRALDAIQFASVYTVRNTINRAISDDKLLNSFLALEQIKI
jgi:uncharacterized protein